MKTIETLSIFTLALIAVYFSPISIFLNPIITILYFVVYLELSKLLYMAIVGIQTPIMLRYVISALLVGSIIKTYEAMVNKDIAMIFTYLSAAIIITYLRGVVWKQTDR